MAEAAAVGVVGAAERSLGDGGLTGTVVAVHRVPDHFAAGLDVAEMDVREKCISGGGDTNVQGRGRQAGHEKNNNVDGGGGGEVKGMPKCVGLKIERLKKRTAPAAPHQEQARS